VNISEKVVRRLMKQECLVAATSKRRRYGSYMGEISPAPDNLLNRDFSASAPNEKWLTDITEFQIPAGKVYLSPMIDCFDGMVVSWSIGTRPDAELVNTMLDAAIDGGRENRLCRAAHRARRQSRPSRPWRASSAFPTLTGPVALAAGLCGPDGPSWPVSGAFPALPHRRGRCGQFRDKSAEAGRRSPDVDT
jgi:hypothetical protein